MKVMLADLKYSSSLAGDFKSKVARLKTAVIAHVSQEENTIFAAIRSNCSDAQQEQLATQFKAVKSKYQFHQFNNRGRSRSLFVLEYKLSA
jgi:hemerythrin superfamily protein